MFASQSGAKRKRVDPRVKPGDDDGEWPDVPTASAFYLGLERTTLRMAKLERMRWTPGRRDSCSLWMRS